MTRLRRTKGGFTILEILASIGILSIIVLMVGQMFSEASRAWISGDKQVVASDLARNALDFVLRDTQVSIADQSLPFAVLRNFTIDPWLGTNDALVCVSSVAPRTSGSVQNDLMEITYWVDIDTEGRGLLRRRSFDIGASGASRYIGLGAKATFASLFQGNHFAQATNDPSTGVIAENVYSLDIICYDQALNEIPGDFYSKAPAQGNLHPARFDVTFVTLSDEQWARTNSMNSTAWQSFVATNAEIFTVSAAFPTRGR